MCAGLKSQARGGRDGRLTTLRRGAARTGDKSAMLSTQAIQTLFKHLATGAAVGCFSLSALPVSAIEIMDDAEELIESADQFESILVSKRTEARSEDNPTSPSLEPISEVSEYEPELAPPQKDRSQRGRASRRRSNQEPRMASASNSTTAEASDVEDDARPAGPRPAKFHGITPGYSTRSELVDSWGKPDKTIPASGGEVLRYDMEPFERVEALIEDETVTVVRVSLNERATVEEMTERLALDVLEPVEVIDPEYGALLAVTFPEKGLTLITEESTAPGPAVVSYLAIEPLDARAFAVRAENRPGSEVEWKLDDLRQAIEIDDQYAYAHWLAAGLHRSVGQAKRALASAEKALEIEEDNPAYRLRRAQALADRGKHDQAVFETRKVLDAEDAPGIVRAEALHTMGLLAALGEASIAEKAIDFNNSAIEIADGLATSSDDLLRRAAKDLLISAHLAIAHEIARGDFPNKVDVVAEWIGRASGLAEERIENDRGGLELRLRVAREALAALAEIRPSKDPTPWVEEARETADQLLEESEDPLFRARVAWELGETYLNALRVEQSRGDADRALGYGEEAIDRFSSGAEPRTESPFAEQTIGRLYFHLGVINAVINGDHEEAVGWYDKARTILTAQSPDSELIVPRQQGQRLVSMAVSYWKQDRRDLAVRLTEAGSKLMEESVEAGVLKRSALAAPYGNLATMNKRLGNDDAFDKFARLNESVGGRPVATAVAKAEPRSASTRSRGSDREEVEPQDPAEQIARKSRSGPTGARMARRPTARGTMTR